MIKAGLALTQIPAYITHKTLAVRKSIEAMRAADAEKRDSISTRSSIMKASAHRLRTFYFVKLFDEPGAKGAFDMRHSFPYFFSLVRISEFLRANFSSTCVRCTHLLKS